MTAAAQLALDVLALVGGWSVGGTVGRRIVRRRRKASNPAIANRSRVNDSRPYGAIPVPWQYEPDAFEPNNAHNREEIDNVR